MTEARFAKLVAATRGSFANLAVDVPGNHFFFIGETGARKTAEAIKTLEGRVRDLKVALRAVTEAKTQ